MRLLRLFLVVAVLGSLASAQEPDTNFTINLDARDVSVNVSVNDAQGRPVTNLIKSDFQIYEDGVLQQIQTFSSVNEKYNILILVDCSNSTQADWPLMTSAIDRFQAGLRRDDRKDDRISVAQFGGHVQTLLDWRTVTGNSLGVQIRSTSQSCNGTDFYGALQESIGRFRDFPNERHGVVVLTDGVQTTPAVPFQNMNVGGQRVSRVSNLADDKEFQRVVKDVRKSGVVFYFVAVNSDLNPDPGFGSANRSRNNGYNPSGIYNMQQFRARMQLIADQSNGRMVFPKRPADVVPLYESIARELGTSYGLSYSPKSAPSANDTRPRKIEVRMRTPGYTVKQNRDTYVPASQ